MKVRMHALPGRKRGSVIRKHKHIDIVLKGFIAKCRVQGFREGVFDLTSRRVSIK